MSIPVGPQVAKDIDLFLSGKMPLDEMRSLVQRALDEWWFDDLAATLPAIHSRLVDIANHFIRVGMVHNPIATVKAVLH